MSNLLVVFSHGKESGPWGSKIQALSKVAMGCGAKVVSVNYCEYPVGVMHDHNLPDQSLHEKLEIVSDLLATE